MALFRMSGTIISYHSMQEKDNPAGDTAALKLVKEMKAEGLIRAFGNGHQVHPHAMLSVNLKTILWPIPFW